MLASEGGAGERNHGDPSASFCSPALYESASGAVSCGAPQGEPLGVEGRALSRRQRRFLVGVSRAGPHQPPPIPFLVRAAEERGPLK